jgi:hypothetical protein
MQAQIWRHFPCSLFNQSLHSVRTTPTIQTTSSWKSLHVLLNTHFLYRLLLAQPPLPSALLLSSISSDFNPVPTILFTNQAPIDLHKSIRSFYSQPNLLNHCRQDVQISRYLRRFLPIRFFIRFSRALPGLLHRQTSACRCTIHYRPAEPDRTIDMHWRYRKCQEPVPPRSR